MQDAIREATVNAILERSEKLELAFMWKSIIGRRRGRGTRRHFSNERRRFISESDKHRELAHRVAEATKQIREESPKKLLDAVKKKLEQEINQRERIPNNWEICDG